MVLADVAAHGEVTEWAERELGASPTIAPTAGRATFRLPVVSAPTVAAPPPTSPGGGGTSGGTGGGRREARGGMPLSEVFRRVEAAKGGALARVQSFSLTQPTLAQVFLNVVGTGLGDGAD